MGTRTHHADLARDLRQSLDLLTDAVEDAGKCVCDVEDAAEVDYPISGEKPDESEVEQAKARTPAVLAALAELENRIRRQVWFFSKARRGLVRLHSCACTEVFNEDKGLRPEGLRPEGLQPEGLQPEGLQPEGLQPEGLQPGGHT